MSDEIIATAVPNFASSETIQIPLSGGAWIRIKKYLNVFDQRRLERAGIITVAVDVINPDGTKGRDFTDRVDWSMYEIERAKIWLVDWLMLDANREPVELSEAAIKNLTPERFQEVSETIFHRVVELAEAKKKKKTPITPTPSVTESSAETASTS